MILRSTFDSTEPDLEALCEGKRVVVCEDHPVFRLGMRDICDRLRCAIVAEVTTGEAALEALERTRPDLLILDLSLPGQLDGRAVHREVRRHNLVPKVLVITSYGDTPSFFDWIHQEDGPDGALSKIGSLHEVKLAIVQVLTSNNKYFSPRFLMREQGNSGNPLTRLTPRELQVLRQVAAGDRLVHIAERYDLSYETVHGYMNNIYCKLNVRPRTLQGAATLYNQWIHAPLPPLDGESL